MISLLDVNVLVALFDPAHVHHETAHAWFAENRSSGWATCPLTENGFTRAVSHPQYPGRRSTVADAIERLQAFVDSGDHHFWPDSTSLRRRSRVTASALEGHAQITTAYLLLLAVENGGRFATFERGVPVGAVPGADPGQVVVLGARVP